MDSTTASTTTVSPTVSTMLVGRGGRGRWTDKPDFSFQMVEAALAEKGRDVKLSRGSSLVGTTMIAAAVATIMVTQTASTTETTTTTTKGTTTKATTTKATTTKATTTKETTTR